jgi:aspartyl-tRNA(Asn)/glutamyl-tRNA(Gln) amidotransferase subunit C
MSQITPELIHKVGKLARLKTTEQEANSLMNDLTKIIVMVEKLQSVDTDDCVGSYTDRTLNPRKDEVTVEDIVDQLATNAPDFKFNFFKVPKVIE